MNSDFSRNLKKDLCKKLNISKISCDEIVRSQFRFLREKTGEYSLRDKQYPNVRIFKWGVFRVKDSKKENYGKDD